MPNELKHVGVLGMRWGRRKGKSSQSQDHKTAASLKKKKISELSNDELKTYNARKQLESKYKELNPSKVSSGFKKVTSVLTVVGTVTAAAATIKSAATLGKSIYEKVSKSTMLDDFVI